MSKKEAEEEIELTEFDLENLEHGNSNEDVENKKNPIKIQSVEEYFLELGFSPKSIPRKIYKEYPDLFGIKLDKKEKDDVLSEMPGIESTPGLQLYVSLLSNVQLNQK